jgi:cell division initiation protein
MSITALEIQEVRFGEVKKGYDPNEVDEFLERVANDVDMLNRALSEAASRIKAAEKRAEEAERKLATAPAQAAKSARADKQVEDSASGEIIAKAFIAAQKSAEAIQDEARKEAAAVYKEAEAKSRDIVRDALTEKQKALDELNRLRESCEKFRTEYLSLIKYFQADAQKRMTVFDEAIQQQSADEARGPSMDFAVANSAAVVAEDYRGAMVAPPPNFGVAAAPVAYQMSIEDDDLDIEEID